MSPKQVVAVNRLASFDIVNTDPCGHFSEPEDACKATGLPNPAEIARFRWERFPDVKIDPADGNLLLDFRISSGPVSALRWDGVSGNPTVRAVVAFGSSTALTGSFTDSDVYQFTFELPPQVTIRTSQVEVCWNSKSNLTYQVQYRSDLTTNLWITLVDCIRSTNSMSCVYDPIVVGQPQRFYRVVLTNCVP